MDAPPKARNWMRRGRRPAPLTVRAPMPAFENVRLTVDEAEASLAAAADRLTIPKLGQSRTDFNILALSGGAAGGAFGAGVLVGLSRTGNRPNFAIVTG